MFVDVKQYPNLIQTISFLLKSYKHGDKTKVSPIGNDETHGILLETTFNHLYILATQDCIFTESCGCRRCSVALASFSDELET
jgi:hypothetical protein